MGGVDSDARDLVEPSDGRQRAGARAALGGARRYVAGGRLGSGDVGDQLVDPEREHVDLRAEGVELVEQHPRELGVVIVEPAGERLDEPVTLLAKLPWPGR